MAVTLKPAQLRSIDDRLSLAFIALDYAIVAGAAAIAVRVHVPLVTAAAIVVIAGRQVAFTNLMHSAAHYALFSRKQRNDHCDWLIALPIVDSVLLYRAAHLEHHREFMLRLPVRYAFLHDELRLPSLSRWGRTWVIFIRPLLGHAAFGFVRETVQALLQYPRVGARVLAYWAVLIAAAALSGHLWDFAIFWVLPLVWLYPVFNVWAEVSDHFGAADETRNQRGVFYELLFKGHETYHWTHHQYPYVPFYRLEALQKQLAESGMVVEESKGGRDFLRIVYAPGTDPAALPDSATATIIRRAVTSP